MSRLIIKDVKSPFHAIETSFSISIEGNTIKQVGKIDYQPEDSIIEYGTALVIPGLFNAHDHLEFSLFPRLGRKLYQNYIEWGNDIHDGFKKEIDNVLKTPVVNRWKMGVLKNILSGVTTVVDHGFPTNYRSNLVIDIHSQFQYIHSIATDKKWKLKVNLAQKPVMIHLGEGTDQVASDELKKLHRWSFFNRKIIAVHLISGDYSLAQYLSAMIWCPDSNLFLYGRTARINELKELIPVFLGTDSPLTASDNFWDHIRLARVSGLLSDLELFQMVTEAPGKFFNLNKGSVSAGMIADLVLLKMKSTDPVHSFFESNPEDVLLVLKNGSLIVFDETLKKQLGPILKSESFDLVRVGESVKFVKGNWSEVIQGIPNDKIKIPLGIH